MSKSPNTQSPAKVLPNLGVSYPTKNAGGTNNTTIADIRSHLTDEHYDWNILDKLSTKEKGLTTCPLMPAILEQTVGNVSIAEERKIRNKQYKNWLMRNRPHLLENELFIKLTGILRKEYGTLFQGYQTRSYLQCVTESLPVDWSIENGLSAEWKSVAEMKGIDLLAVKTSKVCTDIAKVLRQYF